VVCGWRSANGSDQAEPDGQWSAEEIRGIDQVLHLASVDSRIPVSEIYEIVEFTRG
jgi:hypothetical protein